MFIVRFDCDAFGRELARFDTAHEAIEFARHDQSPVSDSACRPELTAHHCPLADDGPEERTLPDHSSPLAPGRNTSPTACVAWFRHA